MTRAPRLLPLLLTGLTLLGCGGSRASSTTTAQTATPSSEPAPDATPVVRACTEWDPDADPTVAPADVAEPPEQSRRGMSGLRFCILRPGTGQERPSTTDRVRVHYTGWTTDGVMFDSSHPRGAPTELPVNGVISGWTQALTHMTVGEVRRLWIPESLAYRGAAGGPRGMLVFDVELVSIEH